MSNFNEHRHSHYTDVFMHEAESLEFRRQVNPELELIPGAVH